MQVSMVRVCPLGEMSGNDIAMSGGEMWAVSPIPCFIGSVAFIGGRFIPCRCQWFGCVIGGGSIPFQVRAVVAMVKFSHLTNFVLNKKLGCIIQNCSLGGCPLSPAARWLSLVAVLFPSRCQWFGCVPSVRCRAVSPIPCFIGSVVSIGGRFIPCRVQWFGRVPSVRCRAVSPIPASSARWLPVVGGSIPLQGSMVRVCHWWRFYSLAGVNGSGVSPR